ncbi:MAG: protein-L-isoaspartate(D-aspartate) O-methyltransferase [Burkholderiales bacterium]
MATLLIRGFIPLLVMLACQAVQARDEYELLRQRMVQEIVVMTTDTRFETGRTALDERVLAAMRKVERHKFVPPSEVVNAYQNRPLPIGYGQTISQPYIVAIMTDLMRVERNHTVLEIGTGSGYQAAVLAELAKAVYTIEIIEPLGKQAQERLQILGYRNVQTKVGDGYYGWEQYAPFDSIIVTAAASHIPPPLIKQLKPGGKMVIPVGAQFLTQYLMLVEKNPDGTVSSKQILPVSFVPLTGGH